MLHKTIEGQRPVEIVCFSPRGSILASSGEGGGIILWDVESGEQIRELNAPFALLKSGLELACKLATNRRYGYWDVLALCFDPRGEILASGWADDSIRLWKIASGDLVTTLTTSVSAVCFHPNGRTLASCGHDGLVKLWDVVDAKVFQTMTFGEHHNYLKSVCFNPNGEIVATCCMSEIKLWDVSSGLLLRTLIAGTSFVGSICFHPSGDILVSGSRETPEIYAFDVGTGTKLMILSGHSSSISSVCFDPKGHILASSSGDKTIKLWDFSSGSEIMTLTGHKLSVRSISFDPIKHILASGSSDQKIKLWII
jgi:WD40 repeat protein